MIKYLKKLRRRFKNWMGFNPPGALTGPGWKSFGKEFKANAPIRYWLTHNFRRGCILPIKWKYEEITSWLVYRTVNRYHILKTGLPPGYIGTDLIMLHANFNILKDFVEKSRASRNYWGDTSIKKSWFERNMPFYDVFIEFRRPDLGIKYLEWGASLDDPSLPPHEQSPQQAKECREMLALYIWWTDTRPNRKQVEIRHPAVKSGDDDIFDPANTQTKEFKRYRADLEKSYKQEEKWDTEDDKMLVRLMKIRRSFW